MIGINRTFILGVRTIMLLVLISIQSANKMLGTGRENEGSICITFLKCKRFASHQDDVLSFVLFEHLEVPPWGIFAKRCAG